jgi:hypothetical protein
MRKESSSKVGFNDVIIKKITKLLCVQKMLAFNVKQNGGGKHRYHWF